MNRPIKSGRRISPASTKTPFLLLIQQVTRMNAPHLREPAAPRTGGNTQHQSTLVRRFATGPSTLRPPELEGKVFPISFKRCLAEESSRRVRFTGIAIIASETRTAFPGSNQSGRKSWNHAHALEIDGSGWGVGGVARPRAQASESSKG
jgi:hypothetical protein